MFLATLHGRSEFCRTRLFLPHAALDASGRVLIKVLVLCMWVEHIVFAQYNRFSYISGRVALKRFVSDHTSWSE